MQYEFHEIKNAIEFDRTVAANVGWKALIATPGNRRRMRIIVALAFFSQWSGNGLVSYYLNIVLNSIGITDPTTQVCALLCLGVPFPSSKRPSSSSSMEFFKYGTWDGRSSQLLCATAWADDFCF